MIKNNQSNTTTGFSSLWDSVVLIPSSSLFASPSGFSSHTLSDTLMPTSAWLLNPNVLDEEFNIMQAKL